MNYWYVARSNELFLDIDNVVRSIKHARSRLQGAIECDKLNVGCVMVRPSRTASHLHVIITLNEQPGLEMFYPERFVWEIILHGDIYRGCCNLMRYFRICPAPDVLISPWAAFANRNADYRRPADDHCDCADKHSLKVMQSCPAAKRLRKDFRATGFFGKPSKNPCTIWPE